MIMGYIVHICRHADWLSASASSSYSASSLDSEGFIHCSKPEQVLKVANMFYGGIPDLCLLWIDPQKLESKLRWEAADNDQFPHLYGRLNADAVFAVSDFLPDADGVYRSLPEI